MSGEPAVSRDEIRKFFARKAQRTRAERQRLLEKAQAEAKIIVSFVVRTYNPLRIYQWGSLVHSMHFTERSDIDIAIEGLAHPFDLHRILDFAETVTSLPLDIVPIEEIAPEYAESIRSRGRLVYERR